VAEHRQQRQRHGRSRLSQWETAGDGRLLAPGRYSRLREPSEQRRDGLGGRGHRHREQVVFRLRDLRGRNHAGVVTRRPTEVSTNMRGRTCRLVVATIAALAIVVAAGVAWATIPDGSGVRHSWFKAEGGALRLIG